MEIQIKTNGCVIVSFSIRFIVAIFCLSVSKKRLIAFWVWNNISIHEEIIIVTESNLNYSFLLFLGYFKTISFPKCESENFYIYALIKNDFLKIFLKIYILFATLEYNATLEFVNLVAELIFLAIKRLLNNKYNITFLWILF